MKKKNWKKKFIELGNKSNFYVPQVWFGILSALGLFVMTGLISFGIIDSLKIQEPYDQFFLGGFYTFTTIYTWTMASPKSKIFRRAFLITSTIILLGAMIRF